MIELIEVEAASNFIEVVLTYVYQNLETEQAEEFTEMAQEQFTGEVKAKAMTVGDYLHQKGRQKGRFEALKSVAKALYHTGHNIDEIVAVTKLSRSDVESAIY